MKEVEDSELLEMMDVCDQEGSLNLPTQHHALNTDLPVPSTAQVIKSWSKWFICLVLNRIFDKTCVCVPCKDTSNPEAEEGEDEAKQKKEAEKKEEQTVHRHNDGAGLMKDEEEKGAKDLLKEQGGESFDWPTERVCHTHERAIPIQETVEALDITEEGKWNDTRACIQ